MYVWVTSTDAIGAFGSVSFAGLAAEKILLAPPLDWYHGTRDCQNLVEVISENKLPYGTFDPSNVDELRKHAEGVTSLMKRPHAYVWKLILNRKQWISLIVVLSNSRLNERQ